MASAEPLLQSELGLGSSLPTLEEEEFESPALIGSENYEWNVIPDLDKFLRNLYMYHKDKGLHVIIASRLLNQICTLAFLISFSGVLLLCINWRALHSECLVEGTCDIMEVAIYKHPLSDHSLWWDCFCLGFLGIFSLYWLWNVWDFVSRLPELWEVAHFCNNKLGVSDRQVRTITWPEFVARLVQVQKTTRLCLARDMTEHDVVSRIMRRDNFLIGMLNKGVLPLHVPVPGLRRRLMLTKTLEWSLRRCILDHMFEPGCFTIREGFADAAALRRRFRTEAALMLLLSPFVLCFILLYFFMRNAEKFYNNPATIGARRWSLLARWRMREFNELDHYISHRLNASQAAAEKYIAQFPSPLVNHVARFVSFVTGSLVALLLFVELIDGSLLERPLYGRHVLWWLGTLGLVLALSRTLIVEGGAAFDPEMAMMEVVAHTHYLPRHWRGRAHSREVQGAFASLFQFKALLFVEELASVLLTPLLLAVAMPKSADVIVQFVEEHTVHVEGVGDVCSMAAFDFTRHGNTKYGSPYNCPKAARSRQGKMEKSFVSFCATYPTWEPTAVAKQMLASLGGRPPAAPHGWPGGAAGTPRGSGGDAMALSTNGIGGRYVQMGPDVGTGTAGLHAYLRPTAAASLQPGLFDSADLAASAWLTGCRGAAAHASASVGALAREVGAPAASALLTASATAGDESDTRVAVGNALLQSRYSETERHQHLQRQRFQAAVDGRRTAAMVRLQQPPPPVSPRALGRARAAGGAPQGPAASESPGPGPSPTASRGSSPLFPRPGSSGSRRGGAGGSAASVSEWELPAWAPAGREAGGEDLGGPGAWPEPASAPGSATQQRGMASDDASGAASRQHGGSWRPGGGLHGTPPPLGRVHELGPLSALRDGPRYGDSPPPPDLDDFL